MCVCRLVSSVRQSLPPDVDKWGVSLQLLMGAVVLGGVVIAGCYEWMQQNVISDPECVDASRYGAAGVRLGYFPAAVNECGRNGLA